MTRRSPCAEPGVIARRRVERPTSAAGAVLALGLVVGAAGPAAAAPTTGSGSLPTAPAATASLRLSGTTAGAALLGAWAPGLAARGVAAGYAVSSASSAAAALAGGSLDGSISSLPLAAAADPPAAPLAVSGTEVVTGLVDTVTHRPVTGVRVDAVTLAQLLSGHPGAAAAALQRANPTAHLPTHLVGLTVTGQSGTLAPVTSWLTAAAPSLWTSGPVDALPPGTVGVEQEPSVTALAATTAAPAAGTGYLGLVDVAQPGTEGLTAAAVGGLATGWSTPGPATLAAGYPLATVETLTVGSGTAPAVAGRLAALLRYTAGAGQQALPAGMAPLPGTLAARTSALAAILEAEAVVATPTPTPTPTATGSPTPSPSPGPNRAASSGTPSPSASPPATPSPSSTPLPSSRPSRRATPLAATPLARGGRTAFSAASSSHHVAVSQPAAGPVPVLGLVPDLSATALSPADAGPLQAEPLALGDLVQQPTASWRMPVDPPTPLLAPAERVSASPAGSRPAGVTAAAAERAGFAKSGATSGSTVAIGLLVAGFALAAGHRPRRTAAPIKAAEPTVGGRPTD